MNPLKLFPILLFQSDLLGFATRIWNEKWNKLDSKVSPTPACLIAALSLL